MKISKILVAFSVVLFCCFNLLLVGCDNESVTDFDPSVATSLLNRLEVEDDNFITTINSKYEATANYANIQSIISAIEAINSSVNGFIESYKDYKIMFASSEYAEIFSYNASGFKYHEGANLINVSVPRENSLVVETGDDECYCVIEVVYIRESNYAIRYFIQEAGQNFGEEILCYFDGSSGRISKRSCVLSQSTSIILLEDFTHFAVNTETGYYYFT